MALKITENLKQDIKSPEITPAIVVKIDGYPFILGNVQILNYIKIGDPGLLIGNDWVVGGLTPVENQKAYLAFDQGTTTRISQKIDPSKGVGASVSQMTLALLDINEEMTQLLSPASVLPEILGRRVTVFAGTRNTSFPQDYNVVFRGVIQSVSSNPTTVFLNLNSTEEKKRVAALNKITSETASITHYKSVQFQDLLYKNREDVQNLITINYNSGGTAGSEVVSLSGGGFTIDVLMQSGVSTASQIRKAIENSPLSNQLVDISITGSSTNPQVSGSAVLSSATQLEVLDSSQFLTPVDVMETFIICEDELIKYTGKSGNFLTGLVRGQNNSVPAFHNIEKSVTQFLKISDNGINIALKLMLSGGPEFYVENLACKSIEFYDSILNIDNAIFFEGIDVRTDYGVAEGDLITITGAANGANNVVNSIIVEVETTDNGSYVVVADNLITEGTTSAVAKFKSQFNVLPFGYAMLPNEVDIDEHFYVRNTFLPNFPLVLFLDEISDGKGFLEKHIYLAMNCISVPRKGRSSIVYTVGPLPTYEVVVLNTQTVENPEQLKVERSLNENFINQVQYDYDFDPVSGKYLTRKNYPDKPDTSLIDILAKPLLIQTQAIRTESNGAAQTLRNAQKWLRRYQRGAEFIKGVRIIFSSGFQVENGDIVAVDYSDLKLSDYERGSRSGIIKLMEVQNIIKDFKTGDITADLVNTVFGVSDRYGLISPSSKVGVGSTLTKVILQKSWSTKPFHRESKKWTDGNYLNQKIIIHSPDWTTVYETFIRGFDSNDPQGMLVDTLPAAPLENFIIEPPYYPNSTDPNELSFWKLRHAFFSPQVDVVAGVSNIRLTVAAGDISKFFVGSSVRIHSYDYSIDSGDKTVVEINGNDIIVNSSLGFIPSSGQFIDLIGFPDKQQAYRVV